MALLVAPKVDFSEYVGASQNNLSRFQKLNLVKHGKEIYLGNYLPTLNRIKQE